MKEFLGFRENECASKLDAYRVRLILCRTILFGNVVRLLHRMQDVDMSVGDRFVCRKAVDDR